MTTKVITHEEAIYGKHPKLLYTLCGEDKKCIKKAKDEGYIPYLFDYDPDYLRAKKHIGRIVFVRYEVLGVNYVIVDSDEIDTLTEKMLVQFFQQDFKEFYTRGEETWQHFDRTIYGGIAFRDGKGYSYGIWDYNSSNF